MVGVHDEVVAIPNGSKQILAVVDGVVSQWRQGFEVQMIFVEFWEIEKIEIVVISAFGTQVQILDVHHILEVFEQFIGHFTIIHQSGSRADVPLVETFLDFLNQVPRKFIVDVEFGVPGKFDRIGIPDFVTGKKPGNTMPDDIIQNDNVVVASLGIGERYKTFEVIRRDLTSAYWVLGFDF